MKPRCTPVDEPPSQSQHQCDDHAAKDGSCEAVDLDAWHEPGKQNKQQPLCEGKNEKPENPWYHAIHDRSPPRGRGKIELRRGEELVEIVEAAAKRRGYWAWTNP